MTERIVLRLPWPPSANLIWRTTRRGITFLSKQYRAFCDDVKRAVSNQRAPAASSLSLTLYLFPPNRRRFDVDNRVKPTLDALTKADFWEDDILVRRIEVIDGEPVVGGAAIVIVTQYVPDDNITSQLTREYALEQIVYRTSQTRRKNHERE